jgi:hypothetical protein
MVGSSVVGTFFGKSSTVTKAMADWEGRDADSTHSESLNLLLLKEQEGWRVEISCKVAAIT